MALVDCTVTVHPNDTVVSTSAAATVQVSPVVNEVQVQGAAGIRGPKGEATSTQTHQAGTDLSGHRAVRVSGGLAYVADAGSKSHAGRCIGITTGAVTQGSVATIQTVGIMTEPSWSWAEGPIFVGAEGVLTQSVTGLKFIQQVGVSTSPTQIDINPQLPIVIS